MSSISTRFSSAVRTLVVGVLFAGGALLLVFGPRQGDEWPNGFVIVDYWEKWTGVEEQGMREVVDEFNRTVGRERRIFVRYLSTSGIEQKTLVATAAGAPPDIAGLYNQNIPQFAAMDALEPLDDLAAARGITAETYKPVFWDECRYDDRLYGLVSTAYDLGLYCNMEIFRRRADALRAAGLDPGRAPRTIAELDAYARAIDQFDAAGRIEVAGYLPLEPGWYQNYTCIWFGGAWWDRADERFTFTNPGVVRAYEWIQSYSRRLGAQAETSFRSGQGGYDSPQNSFLAGRVAMMLQGTFFANVIRNQKPSMAGQWAVVPFPRADAGGGAEEPGVTYCNCDVLVIPRGARHKSEAFEFIAYVNRQDVMERLAKAHCKISPLARVSDDFLTNHTNPFVGVFDALAASPGAHPTETVPILPEVIEEMNNFVQRLALLEVTAAEGLSQMQERLSRKLEDFNAAQRARRAKLARR